MKLIDADRLKRELRRALHYAPTHIWFAALRCIDNAPTAEPPEGGRSMIVTERRDSFAVMTNERYSDAVCPFCGWGIRRGDDVALDQNGETCHAECVEKEEANGHSSIF